MSDDDPKKIIRGLTHLLGLNLEDEEAAAFVQMCRDMAPIIDQMTDAQFERWWQEQTMLLSESGSVHFRQG